MEAVMPKDFTIGLETPDYRAMPPARWDALKLRLVERGKLERSLALHAMLRRVSEWPSRARCALVRMARSYALRRRRRANMAQLDALDDRALWDIGLRRCEIPSVVYRHDPARYR
jgi:uncharacterized protein YjiS (DUF1127 family)